MRQINKLCVIFIVASIMFNGCKKDAPIEPTKTHTDINEMVQSLGTMPDPDPENYTIDNPYGEKIGDATDSTVPNTNYSSKVQAYRYRKIYKEFINLSTINNSALYPGSIVKGKDLERGILSSIGDNVFPRKPLTITMGGTSEVVINPSLATVSSAMAKIVAKNKVQPAFMEYSYSELQSAEQALSQIGIDVKWPVAGVSLDYHQENTHTSKSVLLYFKQIYYTVSMGNDYRAKELFDDSVNVPKLQTEIGKNNPLCVVSDVDYGRVVIVRVKSYGSKSYEQIKSEVKAGFVYTASGVYNVDKAKLKSDYDFEAKIIGGNAGEAARSITNLDDIIKFIQTGGDYTQGNPGYPIAYRVRHVSNCKLVNTGRTTDYTRYDWQQSSIQDYKFTISLDSYTCTKSNNLTNNIKLYGTIKLVGNSGGVYGTLCDIPKNQYKEAKENEKIWFYKVLTVDPQNDNLALDFNLRDCAGIDEDVMIKKGYSLKDKCFEAIKYVNAERSFSISRNSSNKEWRSEVVIKIKATKK